MLEFLAEGSAAARGKAIWWIGFFIVALVRFVLFLRDRDT